MVKSNREPRERGAPGPPVIFWSLLLQGAREGGVWILRRHHMPLRLIDRLRLYKPCSLFRSLIVMHLI